MDKFFYPSHYCFLGFQPSLVVTLPHIWRVYIASQVYALTSSYRSNWGHKIADFYLGLAIFMNFGRFEWKLIAVFGSF